MHRQLTIESMIPEHQVIEAQVKLLIESARDWEAAVASLERGPEARRQCTSLASKVRQLEQAIDYLADGIKNHCMREEELLSPLLSEVLMRGLILEHREVEAQIDKAKARLAHTRSLLPCGGGVASRDVCGSLLSGSDVRHTFDEVRRLVEVHITHENSLHQILEKGIGSRR